MTEANVRRRPDWKKVLSSALFLLLFGLLAWYVYTHWDEMKVLLTLTPETLATLLALGLLSCIVNCLYHLAMLRTYPIHLTLTDWMGVVCVSNAMAYVLPMRADLVFSAAYYKRVRGLAYTKSVAMVAGNVVFGVAFSLLQIFISLLCMGWIDHAWPPTLWALLAAGTACMAIFLWLSQRTESKLRQKLTKYKLVSDVITGFNALLRNGGLLWRLLICMLASNIAHLLTNMVCFQAIGMPVTIYEALFYSSIGWLASVVAIVPGNIGLKESVMGIATVVLGALFSQGVAASLLDRVTIMIVYIFMGMVFAIPVWRNFDRGQSSLLHNEDVDVPVADPSAYAREDKSTPRENA